ncbi:xylulokinase [Luteolibacter sp. AS25]|uniref:xylulokinase n=1 Tax=Luteolibacter sp. AS25 TaxID=3135776 RepID=UPI00398BBA4F
MAYLLGIDIGSSSVKAALMDAQSGKCVGSASFPETEMKIGTPEPGFAEQDPELWYKYAKKSVHKAMELAGASPEDVKAVGIAYQMHGLVCVDSAQNVLCPANIWCDSRAVPFGEKAFLEIGEEKCLGGLLNSPGNFTASKLAWIKENQPEIFAKVDKILLPGDWLAMKLTGKATTTVSGLSEGMFWDFEKEQVADFLMDYYGFSPDVLGEIVPTFGNQGEVTEFAAAEFGLAAGTPVSYRAGDQPNNAFSLNVLKPGEVAATAGTSGVIYGVSGNRSYDPKSRVNSFAHVNHTKDDVHVGILLCINGTGILNAWTKRLMGDLSYNEMNDLAKTAPIGSGGITVLPFGNGAERVLENREVGAQICGLDFNRHDRSHICRAIQEGIVFSLMYGFEVMREMGMGASKIRAGAANLFQSEVFCETLAGVSGAKIELYETDGALGAARGAGLGAKVFADTEEAFENLELRGEISPKEGPYVEAYLKWKNHLQQAV